ncbi:hypothetical protein PAXRUDRAFT_536200 [Paxillus rubicundulus Ve08.2h10]|uniref:Uncharacterized protein n=1 Tax=Paxillus rubicundulus Ve08.2h10 TaxID=930991 RepID=A0A0D0E626_9AGAM|nr:hypothetical protein PAXRUDRAFT_536200 [Paxillus rubicundulus Ve08.2h10]
MHTHTRYLSPNFSQWYTTCLIFPYLRFSQFSAEILRCIGDVCSYVGVPFGAPGYLLLLAFVDYTQLCSSLLSYSFVCAITRPKSNNISNAQMLTGETTAVRPCCIQSK